MLIVLYVAASLWQEVQYFYSASVDAEHIKSFSSVHHRQKSHLSIIVKGIPEITIFSTME